MRPPIDRTPWLTLAPLAFLALGDACGSRRFADTGAVAAPEVVDRPAMRRLTHAQYDNSVRDLLGLGSAGHPAADFSEDEIVGGFAANATLPVQGLQLDQYDEAAADLAAQAVAGRFAAIVGCAPEAGEACVDAFVQGFGKRAFRRPLALDELARYREGFEKAQATAGGDFRAGVTIVVRAMLQSPYFLYRVETGVPDAPPEPDGAVPLTPYEVASRLSYFLWNTMPDDALLAAADAGQLATAAQVEATARRMIQDPKAADALHSFHQQWLGLQALPVVYKDVDDFPVFTSELRDAMSDEALAFVDDVIRSGDGRLETLLSAQYSLIRGPLFEHYGLPAPTDPTVVTRVELPADQRAGVLTLPAVLTTHAHEDQTSIVDRGLLVREQLLCQDLPPPPAGVDTSLPEVDPTVTWRARFEEHRADPACASCHDLMDPLGATFEEFDPIGRYRTVDDHGHPIDATGDVAYTTGVDGHVSSAVDLARRLATADEVRQCFADQWFRYAFGHEETGDNAGTIAAAMDAFRRADFRVTELLVAFTTTRNFRYRKPVEK